jgi:hypothetical protein
VRDSKVLVPIYIVAGLILCVSYLTLLEGGERSSDIALPHLALAACAAVLYGGYYWFSRAAGGSRASRAPYPDFGRIASRARRMGSRALIASSTESEMCAG